MRKKLLTLSILTLALSSFEAFSSEFTGIGSGTPIEAYTGESDCQIHNVHCHDSVTALVSLSGFCSKEDLIKAAFSTCGESVNVIEFEGLIKVGVEDNENNLKSTSTAPKKGVAR
jgi:hypothetical protein